MSADSAKPDNAAHLPPDPAHRREREAIALRENLARRKAQSRARAGHAKAVHPDPAEDPSSCR
jgi:hypothetical protein